MSDPDMTAPPPDLPTIDRYVDLQLLDTGGSADVYRATDPDFGRKVAIKVLRVQLGSGTPAEEFRRECRAIGRVGDHPNIVRVYSAGVTTDGRPYLVMSLMEGSFATHLPPEGLRAEEVLRLGIALCGAVATAHSAGVLHRDIKPENLLRSRFGTCVLADFGVSTLVARTTATASLGLTLQHAAPEVLQGQPATERSDVYSLASTLYQLATGRAPFAGDGDPFAPMQKLAQPAPPLTGNAGLTDLAAVLEGALATDPEQRTPSAVQFGQQLERCAAAAGIHASPMELFAPDARSGADVPAEPGHRRPAPAPAGTTGRVRSAGTRVTMVAALVAVALIGGGAWWSATSQPPDGQDGPTEVLGRSIERPPTNWGDTPQELLRAIETQLAANTEGAIELPQACVSSNLAQLNERSLLSMLDSGAGDRRNVNSLAGALRACGLDAGATAESMVGGSLDPGTVPVDDAILQCTRDVVAMTSAVDDLATLALTSPNQAVIRDRVVTDSLARAFADCLPQQEFARRLGAALRSEDASDRPELDPETVSLIVECIDRQASEGTLGELGFPVPDESYLWTFLLDDSSFPAPLRSAYNRVRTDAALATTAPVGPVTIERDEAGGTIEQTERVCMSSPENPCLPPDDATQDPALAVIC